MDERLKWTEKKFYWNSLLVASSSLQTFDSAKSGIFFLFTHFQIGGEKKLASTFMVNHKWHTLLWNIP